MNLPDGPIEGNAYAPAADSLLERTIQAFLSENLRLLGLGVLHLVGTEYQVPGGRIDILASSNGVLYVIEVKRGIASRDAVGQLQAYVGHMMSAEPQMQVRGILVAADLDSHARAALVATPTIDFWSFKMMFSFDKVDIPRPVPKPALREGAAATPRIILDSTPQFRQRERRADPAPLAPPINRAPVGGSLKRHCVYCRTEKAVRYVRSAQHCVTCANPF